MLHFHSTGSIIRYARFVGRFAAEAIVPCRGGIFASATASVVGVVLQAIVVAFSIGLISALAAEKSFQFPFVSSALTVPNSSHTSLVSAAIVILGLSVSSILIYLGGAKSLELDRRLQDHSLRQVMVSASHRPRAGTLEEFRSLMTEAQVSQAVVGAKLTGRCLRMLANGIPQFIISLASFVTILFVDWVFAVLLIIVGAFALASLSRVNVTAARSSARATSHSVEANRDRVIMIRQVASNPTLLDETQLDRLVKFGPAGRYYDGYFGTLAAINRGRLMSGMFMAVTIALVLIIIAHRLGEDAGQDSTLIVFIIVAVVYFLRSSVSLSQTATSINRFYPQVKHYFDFVDAGRRVPAQGQGEPRVVVGNLLTSERLGDGAIYDQDVGLITPSALSLASIGEFATAFARPTDIVPDLVAEAVIVPSSSLANASAGTEVRASRRFGPKGAPIRPLVCRHIPVGRVECTELPPICFVSNGTSVIAWGTREQITQNPDLTIVGEADFADPGGISVNDSEFPLDPEG